MLIQAVEAHVLEDASGEAVLYRVQTNVLLPKLQARLILGDGIDAADAEEHQVTRVPESLLQGVHLHLLDEFAHGLVRCPCPWSVTTGKSTLKPPRLDSWSRRR